MDMLSHGLSEFDAAALYNYVDILARTTKETVSDITSDDKGSDSLFGSHL